MIDLKPIFDRIDALLLQNTEASLTYAALETRLAIEKVCYERLRVVHDYIPHSEIRRWQPAAIIKSLTNDVDENIAVTVSLYVAKIPDEPGVQPLEHEWTKLGTQVGFDGKKLGELWHALSNVALHVRIPKNKNDNISEYGDCSDIKNKINEAIAELKRMSETTLEFSSYGQFIEFKCDICNFINKRRIYNLKEGKLIYCINPKCYESWFISKNEEKFNFKSNVIDFKCEKCSDLFCLPWRFFHEKNKIEVGYFYLCKKCSHKNNIRWQLVQVETAK